MYLFNFKLFKSKKNNKLNKRKFGYIPKEYLLKKNEADNVNKKSERFIIKNNPNLTEVILVFIKKMKNINNRKNEKNEKLLLI